MRIAIAGGGVSGLSAYLFLVKNLPQPPAPLPPHEYIIYEAYSINRLKAGDDTSDIQPIGAGLGIAPNGMKALRVLDQGLHDDVQARGFPTMKIDFRNSRGWKLGTSLSAYKFEEGFEGLTMISRQDVVHCLHEAVPEGVIVHKTIARVLDDQDNGKPLIEFADGTSESFDLVVGADGVRSKVRTAILGDNYQAYYTGLFGVGGFMPTSLLTPLPQSKADAASTAQVVMTFGGNGFFGYGPCTTGPKAPSEAHFRGDEALVPGPRSLWWSSFERKDPTTRGLDLDDMRKKLIERHQGWEEPTIQRIVQSSELELISVATWVMPKAPTWATDRIVLIGDAAHALPSSSGQGISQALIDSQAISLLLAHHLTRAYTANKEITEAQALKQALRQFVAVRKPPVEKILDVANRMGNHKRPMGFLQEMLMYGVLKTIFTFFPDALNKPVMEYNVAREVEKVLLEK